MVTYAVADPAAGWGGGGLEIYAAAFDGHLFYDLFLQGGGGTWPPRPPRPLGSATDMKHLFFPILHFNYTDLLSAGGVELMLDP